ncbi:tryptophan synthase subunit beta like protein [Halomonas koreensis]|uniref:Tryptophan synthase subunit beta like protein n=1 Tax=Halomonas koreensis TaxID=245385 RepID=A0ABU1FZ99_9GAMM|nr:tryptophan synthase subunit beta like protein [Halomonas koreensis]MDR5866002.1 tryptophan synthase subunit beta like protein [Halomonas koreensis]
MYVQRDEAGGIRLVSREVTPDCSEYLPADSPELLAFLMEGQVGRETARFQASDLAFVRVLEDVLDLLMDKGIIQLTELPEAAQDKVMARQSLRRRLNALHLVGGTEEDDVI